ncbi:MAG: glycosyltransferase family 4 protein [Pyrinomonadaceae bacterium]
MHVVQINSSRKFGGGERHFVDLCRGLDARGVELTIVVRRDAEWLGMLDFVSPDAIKHLALRNSGDLLSASGLASIARSVGADLIHAHLARDYTIAATAAAMSKRAKLVLTRHVGFKIGFATRMLTKGAAAVIAVSDGVARELRSIFGESKVHVVPNGLQLEAGFDQNALSAEFRSTHDIPADAPLISIMGELSKVKGQTEFVFASAEILKEIPDAHFVLVGKDNSKSGSYRREIRRLAKVLGTAPNIVFLDWMKDTRPFFAATDLYISSSKTESFGLTILEAMAFGIPVVATDTDGARMLVADGESGRIVPQMDVKALAGESVKILRDNDLKTRLGKAGRLIAEREYSLERMIQRTIAVYDSILA